jgi:nucleoside-diphosphate-sugar epimerase
VLHLAERRVVVLGSTSAYRIPAPQPYPPPWIDETAPIDLGKPRVQGEEFLRNTCGAIVLRVAGIYGPARNPVDWLRTGRVKPSPKYVNLIHVEDLAAVCLAALERGLGGEIYNVSDGTPRTWQNIAHAVLFHGDIPLSPPGIPTEMGKRVANRKLTEQLGYSIRHLDLLQELGHLS